MNLTKLFKTQAALDEHIMQEHPELRGQNNLDWKLLALQVELGECSNEWRGFKKWSNDQDPRTCVSIDVCKNCGGTGIPLGNIEGGVDCWNCGGSGEITKNPLLEEYADVLSFVLSIGNEMDGSLDLISYLLSEEYKQEIRYAEIDVCDQFRKLFRTISLLDMHRNRVNFGEVLADLMGLGKVLGFTTEQIETAYYAKNSENHRRQENGY
ncbi:dUTPase [Lysinibacillus mangiferihumi]|uniref:dUTPase n=1 Tax=Lysinibacillus mangiferihumi TaxID=1130819 RepID=A0A4U2YZ85_9BACI|nr:dUTP diphosphatase [Lysinibacillus mangiferihumi]TKI66644.1 dUTPase [Lysinibacillus mangiferihumi]